PLPVIKLIKIPFQFVDLDFMMGFYIGLIRIILPEAIAFFVGCSIHELCFQMRGSFRFLHHGGDYAIKIIEHIYGLSYGICIAKEFFCDSVAYYHGVWLIQSGSRVTM